LFFTVTRICEDVLEAMLKIISVLIMILTIMY